MAFEKNSEERKMFADYYRMCERFWGPESIAPENVSEMNDAIHQFFVKYMSVNSYFVRDLMMALIRKVAYEYSDIMTAQEKKMFPEEGDNES